MKVIRLRRHHVRFLIDIIRDIEGESHHYCEVALARQLRSALRLLDKGYAGIHKGIAR